MSQIFKPLVSGGPIPPAIPTSFTTDVLNNTIVGPGTAVPVANNLSILGRDTDQDNVEGIRTDAAPNNGKVVYVELTNRITGTTSIVGAVTGDIFTFSLGATTAVYRFRIEVAGRCTAGTAIAQGVGYSINGSARTNGTTSTIISTPDIDADEDSPDLTAALISFIASGNTVILRATGVAAQTILYNAVAIYVVV